MLQTIHGSLHIESAKAAEAASPALRQAANGFEASFLKELLKPMTEDSMFSSGDDGPGGSMGTVSSMAAEALADGIAKNGGLGIAQRVLTELAPVEAGSAQNPVQDGQLCGGCAPHLAMGTDPSSAAAQLMLGQGTGSGAPLSPSELKPGHLGARMEKLSGLRVTAVHKNVQK